MHRNCPRWVHECPCSCNYIKSVVGDDEKIVSVVEMVVMTVVVEVNVRVVVVKVRVVVVVEVKVRVVVVAAARLRVEVGQVTTVKLIVVQSRVGEKLLVMVGEGCVRAIYGNQKPWNFVLIGCQRPFDNR